MSTLIAPHFIFFTESNHSPDLEFHLNGEGNIFVEEHGKTGGFFFTINPSDWEKLKKFIDEQFASK